MLGRLVRALRKLLCRLLGCKEKSKLAPLSPGTITVTRKETDPMGNATLNVGFPTKRDDGTPASDADVKSWRAEYKADAATNWSPLGPPRTNHETTANIANLTTGKYNFRVFYTDNDDQESVTPAVCDYEQGKASPLSGDSAQISVSPAP